MSHNSLQKMIEQSIAINAAIAPTHSLMAKLYGPAMNAMRLNQTFTSRNEAAISKVFRSAIHINAVELYKDIFQNKTAKGITMFNNPLWKLTDSILSNQHFISAAISKSVTHMDAYDRARNINQVITGSVSFWEKAFPKSYNNKLTSLDAALKGLSAQITFKGYEQSNDELLEQFSVVTGKAASLTASLTESSYATKEDFEKLKIFIDEQFENLAKRVELKIEKTARSPFAKLSLWVSIIGVIFTIWQMLQPSITPNGSNANSATKEDIQKLIDYADERFKEALAKAGFKAETRITCHLRYKPSSKSKCMFCIKPGEIVHIIESNHKWVRVSVIDSLDNLPITGWVMRKHLIRK
jgi:hypothetical protein